MLKVTSSSSDKLISCNASVHNGVNSNTDCTFQFTAVKPQNTATCIRWPIPQYTAHIDGISEGLISDLLQIEEQRNKGGELSFIMDWLKNKHMLSVTDLDKHGICFTSNREESCILQYLERYPVRDDLCLCPRVRPTRMCVLCVCIFTCTAAVWSVTGASWTYCTWMSGGREEPSTVVADPSADVTAISWAPRSTYKETGGKQSEIIIHHWHFIWIFNINFSQNPISSQTAYMKVQ